jgi:DNA-binding HxlR family transcriptional regulator
MTEKELLRLYRTFYIFGDSATLKILFELERYGERTFTELKNNLHINPATLSKKLKILTQVGLIAPDKSHDHLRVFYSLHEHQRPLKRVLDSLERLSIDI